LLVEVARRSVQRECRTQEHDHAVEDGVRTLSPIGGLDEGSSQSGEASDDLSTRPLRAVASALTRGTIPLKSLGLLTEPDVPLDYPGVGGEVLAHSEIRPVIEPLRLRGLDDAVGPSHARVETGQGFFQACRT